MKAAVQLHPFANMRLAVPPLAIGFPLPLPAPGPGFAQPTPQTLRSNPHPLLARQLLARPPPTELLRAQVRSPQSECLLPEASPKWGHFYCVSEGTFLMWFNRGEI